MVKSKTLRELMITKIQALYDIEQQLVKALPKMADAATDPDLKQAFLDHLEETEFHVNRIEDIFDLLKEDPKAIDVDGIRGMIKDAEWCIKNVQEDDALDTALIAAARTVEHYEMAEYMGAQEWAENLEEEEIASLLEETFEEEEGADEKLSELKDTIIERLSGSEEEE